MESKFAIWQYSIIDIGDLFYADFVFIYVDGDLGNSTWFGILDRYGIGKYRGIDLLEKYFTEGLNFALSN